jgi:hypothetical protein
MRLGAPVLRIVRSEDVSKPGVGRRAICEHARALHGACRNRRPCRFSAWGAPVAPLRGEDLGRRRQDRGLLWAEFLSRRRASSQQSPR